MFCPNCGTNNEDDALFCANCGTKLDLNDFNQTINEASNEAEAQPAAAQETVDTQAQAEANTDVDVNAETATTEQAPVDNGFANNGFGQAPENNGFANNGFGQAPENNGFANNGFGQAPENNGFANNGFGQAPVNNGYANNGYQPQPAKPFKVNKKILSAVIAVVVAIIAVVVFINVGKAGTDYKKTAKNYVIATEQCNWKEAYEYLDLPDSEFLTKDALANAHKDDTGEKINSIKVVKGYSTAGNLKGNESVTVTYSTPTSVSNSKDLLLTQTDDKYLLFFKKYKVSSDGIVYKDCEIQVPKGCKLAVNGIEVTDKYIVSDNSSDSSRTDTYKLPYVFAGTNTIKVTSDVTKDYETSMTVGYDEYSKYISYSDLSFTDEAQKAVMKQAETDLPALAKAAYDQKSFDDVKSMYASTPSKYAKSDYEDYVEDFHSSFKTITSYSLSNIKASVNKSNYRYDSEDGSAQITVSLNYTISGKYKYSSSDSETDASNDYSSRSITYKYENGKWVIYNTSLNFYLY